MTKNILSKIGISATITLLVSWLFWDVIAGAVAIIGYTVAGVIVLGAIAGGGAVLFYVRERLLLLRANRIQADKEASVLSLTANGQTWVRDTDKRAAWKNLSNTPLLYVNGKPAQPSELEVALYRERLKLLAISGQLTAGGGLGRIVDGEATVLTTDSALDLLTVFTQAGQAYATIGGQQTGKTYQNRHIAAYWLNRGVVPIVVGPKWDEGEWLGCNRLGGRGDFAAVAAGLDQIRAIAESRHNSPAGHKTHAVLPIFLDDWTPIVQACDNAKDLIFQATTLYASVNILLYFILHADTAAAWGVNNVGAALKNGFVKLLVKPAFDGQGLLIRGGATGEVVLAGESIGRPVKLLAGPIPPPPAGLPVPQLPAIQAGELTTGGPSELEAEVLAAAAAGLSFNEIARRAYGSTGGEQNRKLRAILAQYGGRV